MSLKKLYEERTKNSLKIELGEELCNECNGIGVFCLKKFKDDDENKYPEIYTPCIKCKTKGKIRWTEKILGIKGETPHSEFYIKEFYLLKKLM